MKEKSSLQVRLVHQCAPRPRLQTSAKSAGLPCLYSEIGAKKGENPQNAKRRKPEYSRSKPKQTRSECPTCCKGRGFHRYIHRVFPKLLNFLIFHKSRQRRSGNFLSSHCLSAKNDERSARHVILTGSLGCLDSKIFFTMHWTGLDMYIPSTITT